MLERSHAELNQEHYHRVRTDPLYQARGLMEVQMEEAMMAAPLFSSQQPEPEQWDFHQWRTVQQLRAELIYIRKQLAEKQVTKERAADPF